MALVHNIIIRGWNSMFLQARKLKNADVPDFLNYCQAWYWFVVGHHDSEEAVLFPASRRQRVLRVLWMRMSKTAFHHGLAEMKSYIETGLATPSKYDGDEFVKIFDSFAEAFHSHLTNEPLKLVSLASYNFDMETTRDATTQHALQRYSTTDVLPILWYNLDTKYEGGIWEDFPPLPAPVKWGMVNVMGWWRSNWWCFSSCSSSLVEREELYCLRKEY
ncbi:hypothetical protein V1520DRAFT_203095 [Lipomyces starkeyi]|uniref:Hemerythrin-like domain-containing protein n=1 Tax=Lipomyces starkeyi NRRL Y-11557 TaxID=675824 RepID=A0A1E3Q072_LIPST|nr:hypothetical protein LIPSTDRAFT_145968 [Lipomyces starkeyi NRRL Y-11557]